MLIPPGSILLLDHVAYVAGSFITPWVSFPTRFAEADLVVVYHSVVPDGAAVGVVLQATWDTDSVVQVVATTPVSSPGMTTDLVTSSLGPLIRVSVVITAAVGLQAVLSAWITPKRQ